jgi:SAM-dependent methyltransferase
MRCENLDSMADGRLVSPSADRNKTPIADVLDRLLPETGEVLEISSGVGQHIVHFARRMPRLVWQPTERDAACLRSIAAWSEAEALPNVRPPLFLDVFDDVWPAARADAIVCLNMIHIAPWSATQALLRGARRTLRAGGLLVLYGPFRRDGAHIAESNAEFDRQLQARDPQWGIRNLEDVGRAAAAKGLASGEIHQMPANNLVVSFRKEGAS